ncbi:hypothetical protein [Methylobacterium nigriterrae]|uniref:hypothetical protein n=1 Tax=Methylobacterium nigriterrae TaxID=3127512 RepID=UPI003013E134
MDKHDDADRMIIPCPLCGAETEMGFGLAGGGCGVYLYCEACDEVVSVARTVLPDAPPASRP